MSPLCLTPLLSPLSLKLKEYLTKNTLRMFKAWTKLPRKLQTLENKQLAMVLRLTKEGLRRDLP